MDIPFTGMLGPSDAARHCVTPADFLGLFFSDTVLYMLVLETNNYAMFFGGLQIAMGVADLPEIHDYWSTEPAP